MSGGVSAQTVTYIIAIFLLPFSNPNHTSVRILIAKTLLDLVVTSLFDCFLCLLGPSETYCFSRHLPFDIFQPFFYYFFWQFIVLDFFLYDMFLLFPVKVHSVKLDLQSLKYCFGPRTHPLPHH